MIKHIHRRNIITMLLSRLKKGIYSKNILQKFLRPLHYLLHNNLNSKSKINVFDSFSSVLQKVHSGMLHLKKQYLPLPKLNTFRFKNNLITLCFWRHRFRFCAAAGRILPIGNSWCFSMRKRNFTPFRYGEERFS